MCSSLLIRSAIVYLLACGFASGQLIDETDKEALFKSFIKQFVKTYADDHEYHFRLSVFKNSLDRITSLNSQRRANTDAIYGITSYSDLTPEEFRTKMINGQLSVKQATEKSLTFSDQTANNIKSSDQSDLSIRERRPTRSSSLDQRTREQSSLSELDKYIGTYLSLHSALDGNANLPQLNGDQLIRSIVNSGQAKLSAQSSSSFSERSSQESRSLDENRSQVDVVIKRTNHRRKRSLNVDYLNIYDEALPRSYPRKKDWRESNAISEVDNQGVCGACWAHSTIETIESMAAIRYGWSVNKRLSVQQLIDCSTNNYGCLGGDTCAVLSWISMNKIKLLSEKAYPTRPTAGECRVQNSQIASGLTILRNFTCTNFTNNEIELIKILANHGPVATTADGTLWQDYLGGIIQYNCGREANHAVQIVGYNLETDVPYYIARNTWGPSFGIDGYLHVAIGGNLCALEERVSALDVEMI